MIPSCALWNVLVGFATLAHSTAGRGGLQIYDRTAGDIRGNTCRTTVQRETRSGGGWCDGADMKKEEERIIQAVAEIERVLQHAADSAEAAAAITDNNTKMVQKVQSSSGEGRDRGRASDRSLSRSQSQSPSHSHTQSHPQSAHDHHFVIRADPLLRKNASCPSPH